MLVSDVLRSQLYTVILHVILHVIEDSLNDPLGKGLPTYMKTYDITHALPIVLIRGTRKYIGSLSPPWVDKDPLVEYINRDQ
jgi:hypothetical protein